MTRTATLLLLLTVAIPAAARAQGNPAQGAAPAQAAGQLHGTVVSAANGQPIRSASVAVWSAADSALVTGTLTRADGSFTIPGVPAGQYYLKISALGFATQVRRGVAVTPAASRVELGASRLAVSAVQLEGVAVTGAATEARLAPDRNTYTVRDMPATQGGTAVDVLRNVPSVDVDIDNVVSLRGNSTVVVQINGRPTPMKGSQLGNFLAQLPANLVDKVEVIPNPSARYEPDGMAGIINISLKRSTDLGKSGGLTLGGGTTGQVNTSGNVGIQRGALNLYGSYGFMRDNRPRSDALFRENRFLSPITYLDQQGTRTDTPMSHTLTGSGQYKLSARDELSTDLLFSTRGGNRENDIVYRDLNTQRVLTGQRNQFNTGDQSENSFEGALAFKRAFKPEEHELTAEVRVDRSSEGGTSNITRNTLSAGGTPIGNAEREILGAKERPTEWSAQTDYTRPLGGSLRLETGYKGALIQFHTVQTTDLFDYTQSAFVRNAPRSNDFNYDEQVHAAYGLLSEEVGSFQLQAGVRAERATTRFHLNTTSASYDNHYNSLFPSALAAYNIDDGRQVKVSYSKRIRRPDDTDLVDPTLHYQDPLNLSQGNPYLKPEYIHALELGYQQSGERVTFQLTPFYRRTVNAVRRIRTIDDAGVSTTTFANLATSDAYGTDVTAALRRGRLTGFAGASAYRQVSNASNLSIDLSSRTFGWTGRANATLHVTPKLDVQTLFNYRAPMNVEQGRVSSVSQVNLAIRQKLRGDRVNLTLRIVDPFNTNHDASSTLDPRFYQEAVRHTRNRGLFLSVNYNFGEVPKDRGIDAGDTGGDTGAP
jgi:outer membrane cobalamin receptor